MQAPPHRPIRVARIIARMNLGGPAYHVTLLSARLPAHRYATVLATGSVAPGEESFEDLAARYGVRVRKVPHLAPPLRPAADARALLELVRLLRAVRPDVVHTHTAKAGALGRLAALLALRPRPVLVHTYHGHVLSGYFGRVTTGVYRAVERAMGRFSDCLIGVSQATVDELVELGVAPRERFRVIPLGLQLDHLLAVPALPERGPDGEALRRELGVADGEVLLTFVGRLVPIKRVDVLLDAVAAARAGGAPVRLAVVGDGELRGELEARAGEGVTFLGYRRDMPAVAAATDVAALSSDNEGTPVALIEAAAAGRPAVSSDAGGVRDIVTPQTGRVVARGDAAAMAAAIGELAADARLRERLGQAARAHVRAAYGSERLVADVDALYRELLEGR